MISICRIIIPYIIAIVRNILNDSSLVVGENVSV